MAKEFKIGDRVRRTSVAGSEIPMVATGTIGRITEFYGAGRPRVEWDGRDGAVIYGAMTGFPVNAIELISPAPQPSQERCDHAGCSEPREATWVFCKKHRLDHVGTTEEERMAELRSELGDLRGENHTLRSRLAIAEKSLELALAAGRKAGRR